MKLFRLYLYILSGIISALTSWLIGQSVTSIVRFLFRGALPFRPDFILLPILAICFALFMIATEIFISNPTRYRNNWQTLRFYWKQTSFLGAIIGVIAAGFTMLLYETEQPDWVVKGVSWSLIGLFAGVCESVSWNSRSIEGGIRQANARLWKAPIFGLISGFLAALLTDLLLPSISLIPEVYRDPSGFLILGLTLGCLLNFATSPTYQMALRAGNGFEALPSDRKNQLAREQIPQNRSLQFLVEPDDKNRISGEIEESLSLKLPDKIPKPILIGSCQEADIYLPQMVDKCAELFIDTKKIYIRCLANESVKVQKKVLKRRDKLELVHNQIITFFNSENPPKSYCFVFYDRFLDPQI